jgi:hypothetical protein
VVVVTGAAVVTVVTGAAVVTVVVTAAVVVVAAVEDVVEAVVSAGSPDLPPRPTETESNAFEVSLPITATPISAMAATRATMRLYSIIEAPRSVRVVRKRMP